MDVEGVAAKAELSRFPFHPQNGVPNSPTSSYSWGRAAEQVEKGDVVGQKGFLNTEEGIFSKRG